MRLILWVITFLIPTLSFGQKKIQFEYQISGFQQVLKHPKTEFIDSVSAMSYLSEMKKLANKRGFIRFSIDSITIENNLWRIKGQTEQQFDHISLSIRDKSQLDFLRKNSRLNEKLLLSIPVSPLEYVKILKSIQETYNNNGFPFVEINIDKLNIKNDCIEGELLIKQGPKIIWKEIHVKSDSTFSDSYLLNLLDIHIGDNFNLSKLAEISNQIEMNPFLEETSTSEWIFNNDGAELFVYVKSNPISSVNGIVGLQQNAQGKLTVTGDANIKLINALKKGESIRVRWQSIREGTQSLISSVTTPYLFKTAFGFDGKFELYKRDTSFIDIKFRLGAQYNFDQNQAIKVLFIRNNSQLLSGAALNPNFTNLQAVTFNGYGLEYDVKRIDYLPNPSKGLILQAELVGGIRKYKETDTSSFVNTNTLTLRSEIELFLPIVSRRNVIHLSNKTFAINAANIYQNELFRFGGQQHQRGFNQDELFASFLTTFSLEYRFLLDKNSHAFAFWDQTWYESNSGDYYNDMPFGFGAGFSFGTNIGMFNLSYALGKQFDNPILFSNGKIHFGYIAYF